MKRQGSGKKMANLLASTALVGCLLAIGFGAGKANAKESNGEESNGEESNGRVSLMATLKSAPALQPMAWEITKQGTVVTKTKRYSATFQLVPDDYIAYLECPNGEKRSREFTVECNKTTTVVVACDSKEKQ